MKIVVDDLDGLYRSPHDIGAAWSLLQEYFQVEDRTDLLPHCYSDFDKSKFAGKNLNNSLLLSKRTANSSLGF